MDSIREELKEPDFSGRFQSNRIIIINSSVMRAQRLLNEVNVATRSPHGTLLVRIKHSFDDGNPNVSELIDTLQWFDPVAFSTRQ